VERCPGTNPYSFRERRVFELTSRNCDWALLKLFAAEDACAESKPEFLNIESGLDKRDCRENAKTSCGDRENVQ
jgi:hypothetical protein